MKNQMTSFAMFALNYPQNFIEQAFPNNPHLKAKWDNVDCSNGYGRLVKFWTLLSDDNRDTLANFINDYYNK